MGRSALSSVFSRQFPAGMLRSPISSMRLLNRYIVREDFPPPRCLGAGGLPFVFFVPQLVRLMGMFVRHSGGGSQVLQTFPVHLPRRFHLHRAHGDLDRRTAQAGAYVRGQPNHRAHGSQGIGRRSILLPVGVLAFSGFVAITAGIHYLAVSAGAAVPARSHVKARSHLLAEFLPRCNLAVFDERFPHPRCCMWYDVSASGTHNGMVCF